uniref:Uncharacterized protein n=1 Tax=Arundo donax TaxID=35708 RepID=A0A0A9A2B1_ARUDO
MLNCYGNNSNILNSPNGLTIANNFCILLTLHILL